jgi:UDP-N-acetylglucosamine acyltransferase
MAIHPTVSVDPGAEIGADNDIGPYCVIGPGVRIGNGNRIGAHCVFAGPMTLGDDNRLGHHLSLGAPPQDLGYQGEPTRLEIGNGNFFGDFVQLCRGTPKGATQTTRIGHRNYLMAYCHVGHDCAVGDHVVAANALQLAGHVTVEDRAVFGGLVAVHQHCRVGSLAMVAGLSATGMDIPPYCKVGGWGCDVYGLNSVGMERAGVPREFIKRLREAYKLLFRKGLKLADALARLENEFADIPQALHWVRFFRESKRGVVRERGDAGASPAA